MRSAPPGSTPPPDAGSSPLSRIVLELRESISLRTEEGIYFGELTRFGGGRLEVESEGRFALRGEVEFQLKLPGFNSTVYGVARVLRVISRTALMSQITMRILRMRDKERETLQQFVSYSAQGHSQEQAAGGRNFDAREGNPWGIRPIDAEQRTTAGRLAQRDALRARFAPSAGPRSRSGSNQGLRPVSPSMSRAPSSPSKGSSPSRDRAPGSRSTSVAPSCGRPANASTWSERRSQEPPNRSGRDAVSDALGRNKRARQDRVRGEPELSDHEGRGAPKPPPRPTASKRRELRAAPRLEPRPAPARIENPRLPNAADPQVSLRLGATPPQVFVRYSSRAAYLGDYQSFLSRGLLFLKFIQQPPEQGSYLSVNMLLPSGLGLTIDATVNSVLSTGFGLGLHLDQDAKALLASASRV